MEQVQVARSFSKTAKDTVSRIIARASRAGNSLVSLMAGLLAACMILYSGYVLYDTAYTQANAGNAWDLLQYRPEIIDDGEAPLSGSLAAVNQDYRAWLTVYGTGIDFPVMQGEDDLYYASHDIYGEVSLTGAIYLSYANSRSMSDSYNLIYGHHMDSGAMFGSLDGYRSESWFDSHREGVVVSGSGVYDLTAFAVIDTDAYESRVYSVGSRSDAVLSFLKNPGGSTTVHVLDEATAAGAERILALSTCASAETNGRLVVFYSMTQRGMIELEATGYGVVYDGRPHGLQNVTTNYPEDACLEYSVDDGATWTDKEPTLTDAGTLTVRIRATSELYGTAETTETIQVNRAPLVVTVHNADKIVGDEDPVFTAAVTGLVDDFTPVYEIRRPGAGTDEAAGSYPDALVAEGEEIQGNYTVSYQPGDFTITELGETAIIDDNDTPLGQFLEPKGDSSQGRSWAFLNLASLLVTVYVFLPLTRMKEKFGKIRRSRGAETKGDLIRFWIGLLAELAVTGLAVAAFVLTQDLKGTMILIDAQTPLMLLLLGCCLGLDMLLPRQSEKNAARA